MKTYIHSIIKFTFISGGLVVSFSSTSSGDVNLNGNWTYQDSKSESGEVRENYSASVKKNIPFTELMDLDLGMRANRDKRESVINDNYSPSIGYHLSNDIFSFNLTAHANKTQNSTSDDSLSKNVSALWNSAWKASPWYPDVSLNYNGSWLEDDVDPHNSDTSSSSLGGSLIWDFGHTRLHYSYTTQEDENFVTTSKSESSGHNLRLNTSASFWNRKGTAALSSHYSYSESEDDLPVVGGFADRLLTPTAYFGEETGVTFTLTSNGALTNNDKSDNVIITDNDLTDFLTIAIRVSPPDQANILYLYIDDDDVLSAVDAGKFTWDIYTSTDNSFWTLRQSGAAYSYNIVEKRFEININNYSDDYIAVRASSDADPVTVTFSEVEAIQQFASTEDRVFISGDQSTISNELDLGLRLRPNLQLTSNLSFISSEYSSGKDRRETDIGTGVNWSPKENLDLRLSGAVKTTKTDGSEELQDRNYSMSVSVPPISTVDTIYSVTLKEKYRGGDKLSISSNYNFQALARVYTDLDARYTISHAKLDDKEADSSSSSNGTSLYLTARLVPGLVGNWMWQYNKRSGDSAIYNTNLDLNWRVSDLVSLSGGYRQTWASTGGSSSANVNLDIALSRNMQLTLGHSYKIWPDPQHDSSFSWRWIINDYISLFTSGTYQQKDAGDKDWTISSRLNASFSAL